MTTKTTKPAPAPAPAPKTPAPKAPAPKAIALTVNNVKKAIKDKNADVLANLLTRANKMPTDNDKAKALKIELLTLLVDAQKASTPAPAPKANKAQKASTPAPAPAPAAKQEAREVDTLTLTEDAHKLIGKTLYSKASGKARGTIIATLKDDDNMDCILFMPLQRKVGAKSEYIPGLFRIIDLKQDLFEGVNPEYNADDKCMENVRGFFTIK